MLTGQAISTEVAAEELDHVLAGALDADSEEWNMMLRAAADGPQRDLLREALSKLHTQIPADGEQAAQWLAGHIDPVNASAPHVGTVAVFGGAGAVRCKRGPEFDARSESLEWVNPHAVVSTPDRVWGEFDRAELDRRSLHSFCTTLRAADTAPRLERWIDEFTIGRLWQPVRLDRIEGPAGPVYASHADGTHRRHFARVFGLPPLASTFVPQGQAPRSSSFAARVRRWFGGPVDQTRPLR
ncbi:hypothetical protein ACWDUL_20645 [Nocardia niigatensis]